MGINKKSKGRLSRQKRKRQYGASAQRKVKFVYGLQEKRFRNHMLKAEKRPGQVGTNISCVLEQIEQRCIQNGFTATKKRS